MLARSFLDLLSESNFSFSKMPTYLNRDTLSMIWPSACSVSCSSSSLQTTIILVFSTFILRPASFTLASTAGLKIFLQLNDYLGKNMIVVSLFCFVLNFLWGSLSQPKNTKIQDTCLRASSCEFLVCIIFVVYQYECSHVAIGS